MVREIIGIPVGNNEVVKDCEVKECTSEVTGGDISPEQQDILSETTNFDAEKPEKKSDETDDQKVNSLIKPSSETSAVENARKKSTPQNISDVTLDKQTSTPVVMKNYIDEDNWSMAPSAVTEQTARSRVTTGVAPTFASDERIQKRKEYYAKLEEKRKALEAERQEYKARTKEEEEAAIKELRKTMVHRANPVPSFYYEKAPPKKEIKKLPTTRPTSPKFTRRKSCSDVISRSS